MTLWWTLLKLLRYLLPFLHEVTREETIKDEEDFIRAFYIRKTVYRVLWRLVIIAILGALLFYKIIPMYSENVVMQHEITALKKDLDKAHRSMLNAQDNASDLRIRNTSLDMEVKRLNATLLDCRADLSHERALRNQPNGTRDVAPILSDSESSKNLNKKVADKLNQIK